MTSDPNLRPPGPDFDIADTISTADLIRFMSMPGVPRLLAAFSRIMPGRPRDSLINHAEAIAEAYDMPPPGPMADPLLVAADHFRRSAGDAATLAPEAPQIEGPKRQRAPDQPLTVEDRIVALRMERTDPVAISNALNVELDVVTETIKLARTKGGLKFPKVGKTYPDSGGTRFHTDWKTMSSLARLGAGREATKYGMTGQQLVAARKLFVQMRKKQRTLDDIAKACRIPEDDLMKWLYKARAAGHKNLPLWVSDHDIQARPQLPLRPHGAPIRLKSYADYEAMPNGTGRGAMTKMKNAAESRGVTITEYEYLREVVVDLAMSGMRPIEIANQIGENPGSVTGMLTYARKAGVELPVLERWAKKEGAETQQ